MRSEQVMLGLIVDTARNDERIRAVLMNGSRANPKAPRDVFQDYDIVYLVTDPVSFRRDPQWIRRFGELMILQLPDEMKEVPPADDERFVYLMQFMDGNRIDLTLHPAAKIEALGTDSLTLLLLDKDGIFGRIPPASERDYLPRPPSAKKFSDCCNEFWWMSLYVAKGLGREEIIYAKANADQWVRGQLMKMLTWHIGVKTDFSINPGKEGKYFQKYLEPEIWDLLQKTYADADYDRTWDSLLAMCSLFRWLAVPLAEHFGFDYPLGDDQRVSAHLKHIRELSQRPHRISADPPESQPPE